MIVIKTTIPSINRVVHNIIVFVNSFYSYVFNKVDFSPFYFVNYSNLVYNKMGYIISCSKEIIFYCSIYHQVRSRLTVNGFVNHWAKNKMDDPNFNSSIYHSVIFFTYL